MKELSTSDRYTGPRPARRRPLLPVSLAFYGRVLLRVIRSGLLAAAGRYDDEAWQASSVAVLRICEAVGMDVEVEGLDRLRSAEPPVVLVGNHMSTLETFLLPAFVRPCFPVTFVVKRSLVTYPVFGAVMRSRDPVVVGRENPREDLATVLREGMARLRAGVSMVIFPQATRSHAFDPAAFNSLGVKLAARAGTPVIPFAVRSDAWGTGRRLRDFGPIDPSRPVRIAFGAPLGVEGRGAETQAAVVSFIESKLRSWGVSVP